MILKQVKIKDLKILNKTRLNTYFPNNKLSIIISAMPCSGKSTIAKKISKKMGLTYVDGGDMIKKAMKEIAIEDGFSKEEVNKKNWWSTKEGMKFLALRKKDNKIDKRIDEKLIKKINNGNIVITSWTMPWLSKYGIKIWLKVDDETRINRCMLRDNLSFEEAREVIKERDKKNTELYKKLYGFEYGKDLSPFDLILDASVLNTKSLEKTIVCYLKELKKMKKKIT